MAGDLYHTVCECGKRKWLCTDTSESCTCTQRFLDLALITCVGSAFLLCAMCWRAVDGNWHLPAKSKTIPDPMNGEPFINVPDTQARLTRTGCPCSCAALVYCVNCTGLLVYLCTDQWVTASHSAQPGEVEPFVRSLQAVPKSGLHNPLKNPDRRATAP